MATPFDPFGRVAIGWINNLGAAAIFFGRAFLLVFRGKQTSPIIEQLFHIGAKTMGIVSLIGLFTGMVMALDCVYESIRRYH